MSFAEYSAISCTFSIPEAIYPRNSSFYLRVKHKKPEQFIVLSASSYRGKVGMDLDVVSVLLVSVEYAFDCHIILHGFLLHCTYPI